MDLLYLDYNCFQRRFDDPQQTRIQIEALACQEIFNRAAVQIVQLVWSFMHEDETTLCPFPDRKEIVLGLATLCQVRFCPDEPIYQLAQTFLQAGRFSARDAIHLACAVQVGADYFLTCDDDLSRQAQSLQLNIKVMNPVDYIRQETP
ncbi:type II toxin-antitoxin system VapC family toxin [Microseira wollei]|uniref:PIN domain-containing protein n=1 Tax=Microseira wollei NIES-4236 TaxID=2530354 RepID=A0AAV3XLZ8_9CYAN|nr:PIN domain-containing protein [Microseira wollei]GET41816.1 hypothetical protein MiSe_66300 [Microseira wollei NIES-4236]